MPILETVQVAFWQFLNKLGSNCMNKSVAQRSTHQTQKACSQLKGNFLTNEL